MNLDTFKTTLKNSWRNRLDLLPWVTDSAIQDCFGGKKKFTDADTRFFIDFIQQGGRKKEKSRHFFTKRIKLFHASKRIPKDFLDDFTRSKNGGFLPETTLIQGERCHHKPVCNDPDGGSWQFCILNEDTFFSGKDLLKDYLNLQLPNFYRRESQHALTEEQKIGIRNFIEKYGSPEFVQLGWDLYTGFCYSWSNFVTA
ncbi:MAG: hypothetical protein WC895_04540, partial [Candidatus Shapirobacteria bacterium]